MLFVCLLQLMAYIPQGPWNLGRCSKPCGYISCAWVLLIIPILCFPAYRAGAGLDDLTMNYTCLIYGGVMMFALLWYAIDARKWFKGKSDQCTVMRRARETPADARTPEQVRRSTSNMSSMDRTWKRRIPLSVRVAQARRLRKCPCWDDKRWRLKKGAFEML
jgi:hypothetical protein